MHWRRRLWEGLLGYISREQSGNQKGICGSHRKGSFPGGDPDAAVSTHCKTYIRLQSQSIMTVKPAYRSAISHPNIVKCVGVSKDGEDYLMVTEFCHHKSVSSALVRLRANMRVMHKFDINLAPLFIRWIQRLAQNSPGQSESKYWCLQSAEWLFC